MTKHKKRDEEAVETVLAHFFNIIRIHMEEQDVSISELARRTGITRFAIHEYFRGNTKTPKILNLILMAQALGLSLQLVLKRETK
jgi:transcriptional regulator with XRE-family HTH domain